MTPHKIRQIRDRHGLSQEKFAQMAYTTKRTVQRWEQGKAPVCPARYHTALYRLSTDQRTQHPDTMRDLKDHIINMRNEGWDV